MQFFYSKVYDRALLYVWNFPR